MGEGDGRKHVLYVWPYREWGGAQIYFMGIMKLAGKHFGVSALMPSGSSKRLLEYLNNLDVPFEVFEPHMDMSPALSLPERVRRRWQKIRAEFAIARRIVGRRRQELLHVDFGPWSSFLFLFFLSLRNQVIVTLHTALPRMSFIRRSIWKMKFSMLTTLSRFHLLASNMDVLKSLTPFVSPNSLSKIQVAYSGVDAEEIKSALSVHQDRDEVCRRLKLPEKPFLVFAMGQFIDRKGCWVLLDAARSLAEVDKEFGVVWISTAPLNENTRNRIEEYNLGNTFRIVSPDELGGSRLDLLGLLRIADLFVLPSLMEGLPVALLEAMALGKASIASNINAVPEAVVNGETGLLVAPGDSTALADAISRLKNDNELRDALAKAGQAFVFSRFDEKRTAQITVDLYESCQRTA